MRRWVVVVAVLALAAGCQCEAGEGGPSASGEALEGTAARGEPGGAPRPPTGRVAVTEDGETVVFAGPRTARESAPVVAHPERLVREPNEPDPEQGAFTLEEAVEGLPIDGQLVAEIGTELGTMFCDLYADRAPRTVANFVGLARGKRPWWDARAAMWRRHVPYYGNTVFHRVIPGYLVQGGDYLGDGSGTVGYTIPFEPHETLSHDRAGRLVMATTSEGGRDSAGAQFYVLDGPAPQLDGTATVFGQCRPEDVVMRVARVPQSGAPDNRPLTPVRIARVLIRRVEGGAAAARITVPQLPPGEPAVGRGASPGPSEIRSLDGMRRRQQEAAEQLRDQAAGALPPR